MVRWRLQLAVFGDRAVAQGPTWDPGSPHGSVLQVPGVGAAGCRRRGPTSEPAAVAANAAASKAPAMARRRNPAVRAVPAVLVVMSWIWLVLAEEFIR